MENLDLFYFYAKSLRRRPVLYFNAWISPSNKHTISTVGNMIGLVLVEECGN